MQEVVRRLQELVALDTVSSRTNAPFVEPLRRELDRRGFRTQLQSYTDARGVEKHNLIAIGGPDPSGKGEGGLAFVGHTDTVPYDPAWGEALRLTEKEGRLYGRGSADTKAFVAAVLVALDGLQLETLARPLLLIFTADEEVGCVGAKHLADAGLVRPAHAIVGEPTELVPIRAHKGYWLGELEVEGQEGHSAYPHVGRNAILDAARLLERIRAIGEELKADRDDTFDPPWTTLNVGLIEGGKARNIIPGSCRFPLEWRPVPGRDAGRVARLVERELAKLRAEEPGFAASFTVHREDDGVITPKDAAIVRWLEGATGHGARTIPFGTELPYLTALGAQGCVCGPGDIRVAHKTGEYVPQEALERAVQLYKDAIEQFCRA